MNAAGKETALILQTPRLLLRPFRIEDAADVYAYARDPRVGPIAGWQPHQSEEESREIIRTVFSASAVFAVVRKDTGRVVGSAGFVGNHPTGSFSDCPDDEVGYALSPAEWGSGLIPETVKAVLEYGFTELGLKKNLVRSLCWKLAVQTGHGKMRIFLSVFQNGGRAADGRDPTDLLLCTDGGNVA